MLVIFYGGIEKPFFFSYNEPMEIMSARDLSKYLKINEKKIYKLVQESKVPYLRIGGKLTFAREVIDQWLLENTEQSSLILLAGSDDLLLRHIIEVYNSKSTGVVFYAPVGSINGLKLLQKGAATISCVHILDTQKKESNLTFLDRYLNRTDFMVIHLFMREQGIYVPKNNPDNIHTLDDIREKGITFVNRNLGSGTRVLIDFLLHENKIDPAVIKGYGTEVGSHLEAALMVSRGDAQASFGIKHVAHLLGLDFVHQFNERFDLVIPKEHYFSSQLKTLLSFFDQAALLHNIRDYTGYDISGMGNIVFQ